LGAKRSGFIRFKQPRATAQVQRRILVFIIRYAAIGSAAALLAASAMAQGGITTSGSTSRPIPMTGRVVVDDGTPLPVKAKIELVCPPHAQGQGNTDSKGNFAFELGQDRAQASNDAGMSSAGAGASFAGPLLALGRPVTQMDGFSVLALVGCFLRASVPGYTSDTFDMGRIHVGDGTTDVGTLFVHPAARAVESTVSASSLNAPKEAQKALDKARNYAEKRQFSEAEIELTNAIRSYPKYADAWQELGLVMSAEKNYEKARVAYLQAAAADPTYPRPLISLALLASQERHWQESLDAASALIKLDPKAYPQAYYFSAVAYYNLSDAEKAFENARTAVELDTRHATPLAEKLLGLIYFDRGDFKAAAEQYRNCIDHMGDSAAAESVKTLLAQTTERVGKR
jgi:tetratricopeptide (TPR) repeat protein